MSEKGVAAQIRKNAKNLDELREEARKLHDEMAWGNRKDIGKKYPRSPLSQDEYNERSRALHENQWVKISDALAVLANHVCVDKQQLQDLLHTLNESLKITQDEIERDSFKDQQEVFDSIFNDITTFERRLLGVGVEAT